MATGISARPDPAEQTLRRLQQGTERRRPITHGWYMRGKRDRASGQWTPEPGLPSDVMVYLDMGDNYVREMYPDKGFLALSEVPTKKATANLDPEFAITPPKLEVLQDAIEKLKARRPEAVAAIEAEILDVDDALAQPAGLMGGEAAQLRKKRKGLLLRIEQIQNDANYNAMWLYRKCIEERQAVVRSQMPEAQAQAIELQREVQKWDEHLASLPAEAPTTASTPEPATRRPSTPPKAESSES